MKTERNFRKTFGIGDAIAWVGIVGIMMFVINSIQF